MSTRLTLGSVDKRFLIKKNRDFKTGIVHIGLGNFHRAHLAVYTAIAMQESGGDWGVCAYTFRNHKLVESLKNQENLYSVVEIDPNSEAISLPNVHTDFIAGYENAPLIIDRIGNADTKIVSLTVTEAGYYIDNQSGGIKWEDADIENDRSGKSPRTIYGLLIAGIAKRGGAKLTIMSCDNISSNGHMLKKLLLEYTERTAPELVDNIKQNISFPNSMVDRIVPGTEDRHRELAASRLGVIDENPVPCEKFSMWAIEDEFAAGRPAWESAGVIFTDEVAKYEDMKLRLLNGSHSLLAYLGGLKGCPTIPDCKNDPQVEKALRKALYEEFLPSVAMPSSISADSYIQQLYSRWSNTTLGDRTSRVGSDGSTKLPQRIAVPAQKLISSGKSPTLMALILAAWMSAISPFPDERQNSVCKEMKDPYLAFCKDLVAKSENTDDFVHKFFLESSLFSKELSSSKIFVDLVSKIRKSIFDHGISQAIEQFI